MSVIQEKLKLLPDAPGVYLMMDRDGVIIYVGKARVLKNRVRQYFHSSPKPPKVQAMVENIADFSYVVTPSEVDALSLENTFIKKYKPKYNILLKDDKTYPYIKLHTKEPFPHISITRRIQKDGKVLRPLHGRHQLQGHRRYRRARLRRAHLQERRSEKPQRPCLNYHLGRCPAPCAGYISQEDYSSRVAGAASFLAGNYEEAEELLREKMLRFAENEEFELALEYRDRIEMLSRLKLRRITAMPKDVEADIWARATNGIYGAICVLVTRRGIMQGSRTFPLEEGAGEGGESFLSFLTQYYSSHELPHELVTDEEMDDANSFWSTRAKRRGRKAEIVRPRAGRQARSCWIWRPATRGNTSKSPSPRSSTRTT